MAGFLAPSTIVDAVEQSAITRASTRTSRLLVMSILGGMFISVGALLAVVVAGGSPELRAANPGLGKLLLGAVFPVGFIAVVLTGADLFTSNTATFTVATYRRRMRLADMVRVLSLSWALNFVGALLVAFLFGHLTGLLAEGEPWTAYLVDLADGKVSHTFVETFLKGVLANVLVCTAAWQAYAARDVIGKIFGIWFPVMAFVALGMEHCIANMFFIPAAMMSGLELSVVQLFTANLVPATLGNVVGGAVFIGLAYAWIYTKPEKRVRLTPDEMADAAES